MAKAVTLSDIAKVCGTSVVTVSKALSNKKGPSDELREKIKKTADEMGYVPVKSSDASPNTVGVLIPEKFMNPNGSFYWAMYNALVKVLDTHDYYCILETLSQENENALVMPKLITDNRVYSLISLGQVSTEYARELNRNIRPLLLLDYYLPDEDIDSVISNGFKGSYRITNYLYSMGHRRIGFVGSVRATSSIMDRYMGFLRSMMEKGMNVNNEWVLDDRDENGNMDIRLNFPAEMPTAFVCNCDETAFMVIRQLKEKGYRVPDDVSVVGYDNYLISEVCEPPITTISVNAKQMAEKAADALLERTASPDKEVSSVSVDGELVEKESVKRIR